MVLRALLVIRRFSSIPAEPTFVKTSSAWESHRGSRAVSRIEFNIYYSPWDDVVLRVLPLCVPRPLKYPECASTNFTSALLLLPSFFHRSLPGHAIKLSFFHYICACEKREKAHLPCIALHFMSAASPGCKGVKCLAGARVWREKTCMRAVMRPTHRSWGDSVFLLKLKDFSFFFSLFENFFD